jgi:hypothetical protein
MSGQFNLERAEEGTWRRKAIPRSQDLARKLPQKWVETGGAVALDLVFTWSDQSGKTWL